MAVRRQRVKAKKVRTKKRAPIPDRNKLSEVASEPPKWTPGDPVVAARRRAAVSRLETSGHSLREIADTLLQQHMNGDTTLFTFLGPDNRPIDPATLTYEQMRARVYQVVKFDVNQARAEDGDEEIDPDKVAHERWVLLSRLRKLYKHVDGQIFGIPGKQAAVQDPKHIANLTARAIELAVRMGRLGGIESDKPIEIKLPELYIAAIDESGVVSMRKEKWDGRTETIPNHTADDDTPKPGDVPRAQEKP